MQAPSAAAVITPSEFVRLELIDEWRLDPDRVASVPIGVSPEFSPGDGGSHQGRPRLLFAGAAIARKNLRSVLRAMTVAPPGWALADAELTITGACAENHPEVRRAVADAGLDGRVRWLGLVRAEEMPDVYRAADVLVHPSLQEGCGLPPLEAMACGTPVVASLRGALPEVVGDAALLVDPTSAEALAYKIERALSDGRQRTQLIEAGLGHAARHTWARSAEGTLAVYRDALG